MTYDGYGRLKTKHVPEQNAGTATTWDYNSDDTIQRVTDARGAIATYGYNGRHLVTGITYSAPVGITSTQNVSYGYDAAGNRTSMTDGMGSMSYGYDQLSRLTSETRYFSALGNSTTGGNYGISYQYNFANQLTSITDPFGAQIGYTRDAAGRTTAVTGSGFANVSSYVSNIQYRAWGGIGAASYGNDSASTTSYNNRLQPVQFRLTDANSGASYIRENYAHYGDGHLQSVTDLDDTAGTNPPATLRFLSRSYGYDQTGRVSQGYSPNTAPFNQTYSYDAFDNMTSRAGSYYWQPYQSETFSYTDNRHNDWSYYADGQVSSSPATTTDDAHSFYYDAAARLSTTIDTATNRTVDYRPSYDGDGKLASEWSQTTLNGYPDPATSSYIVRSTVIGEVLTRLDQNGNKSVTHVPAEGLLFASQGFDYGGAPYVSWIQRNPLGITETGKGVYDPLGNYIPFQQHGDPRPPAGSYNSSSMSGLSASMSNANDYGMGCFRDGVPTNCNRLLQAINSGQARALIVSGPGASRATLLRLGIIVTEGPLHNDTRLWGVWALTPGGQRGIVPNPQNSRRTAYVDEKILNSCTEDYFGVSLVNFKPSVSGGIGEFTGTGPNYLSVNPNGPGNNDTFTIRNNATTYSNSYLKFKQNEALSALGLPPDNRPIVGLAPGSTPYVNYTGYDVRDPMEVLKTQIHELGHSLDRITQIGYDDRDKHPNKRDLGGRILEDCVRRRRGFRQK